MERSEFEIVNFGQRNLHYLIASESEKNCTRVIGQVTGTLLSAVLTMVDKIILIGLSMPFQ